MNSIDNLKKITKIILPGVSVFNEVLNQLFTSRLKKRQNKLILKKQIPILGMCVDIHILDSTIEIGSSYSLNYIESKLKKLQNKNNFNTLLYI